MRLSVRFIAVVACFTSTMVVSPATLASRPEDDAGLIASKRATLTVRTESEQANPESGPASMTVVRGSDVGVHVLTVSDDTATEIALLNDPEVDTAGWQGFGCTTADGRYEVVVYGTLGAANHMDEDPTAGYAAIVNLSTGVVTRVPERVGLYYHTPGCGRADVAILTRPTGEFGTDTEAITVALATGDVVARQVLSEQVTSVVPTVDGGLAGARGSSVLVQHPDGTTDINSALGQPTELQPRVDGGVDYLTVDGAGAVSLVQFPSPNGATSTPLDSGKDIGLFMGESSSIVAGHVVDGVIGDVQSVAVATVPVAISPDAARAATAVSETGGTETTYTVDTVDTATDQVVEAPVVTDLEVSAESSERGPGDGPSRVNHSTAALAPTDVSPCAVGRNDRAKQVFQPSIDQIEWAVDLAVQGQLLVTRPADWGGFGLAAYQPQVLIPAPPALHGGGTIPPQVLLAIVTQESNLKHASWHVPRGMYGNPLIADYYGSGGGSNVDYSSADCGYGVGQVTSGMRTVDTTPWSSTQKQAIAFDYAANIAGAAYLLAQKWNQVYDMGLTAQTGSASELEAWYFAIWAYNTGAYSPAPGADPPPYGVGWTNNPRNPNYAPLRQPFLHSSYVDANTPSLWPYQERVFGWMSWGFYESGTHQYQGASGELTPAPITLLCVPGYPGGNNCNPTTETYFSDGTHSYCTQMDRALCKWHLPVTWPDTYCTSSNFDCPPAAPAVYSVSSTEPANPSPPYSPACTASFATGTTIVDNVLESKNRVGCPVVTNSGSFAFAYGGGVTTPPLPDSAQVDLHQLGSGFRGQFWWSHTYSKSVPYPFTTITGTWTPGVTGWRKIWVHVPAIGAETVQAEYVIKTSSSATAQTVVVNQRWNQNHWIEIGRFNLGSGAKVSLSNLTQTDYANSFSPDIAWDAMAFEPTTAPSDVYVALGDSYSAGEGLDPYEANSDIGGKSPSYRDACHRSSQSYAPQVAQLLTNVEFHFIACSGATIPGLTGVADPDNSHSKLFQWNEVPQLYQGYLTPQTTVVSVGIGGNDVRFADVLEACAVNIYDCSEGGWTMSGDSKPIEEAENDLIDALQAKYVTLFNQIHTLAPNAQILAIGYPLLFPSSPSGSCSLLSVDVQLMMNRLGVRLNSRMAAAAATAGATYVSIVSAYTGHEVCSSSERINATVLWSSSGSSLPAADSGAPYCEALGGYKDCPGSGSFHPKSAGHASIVSTVFNAIT